MGKLATRHQREAVLRKAGYEANHCAPLALARALQAEAGEPVDNEEALAVWLPVVKEQIQRVGGMMEDGYHYGNLRWDVEVLDIPIAEHRTYLREGADNGNPYAKRWDLHGTGDRRYDCPTVARWVRDNPEASAILRIDGHAGFAHRGKAFDLRSRQRVDYAIIIETEGREDDE